MLLRYDVVASPLGPIRLVVNAEGHLRELQFREEPLAEGERVPGCAETVATQLRDYFEGSRRTFELPLSPEGTEFERRVWTLLEAIPYGTTRSYGALAKELGDPNLSRAVGRANGANPIAIVVPCHRVVGARGDLTGFAGGLQRKEWLLRLEGALPQEAFPF